MTPKAQRIAIAEVCGWKNVHVCNKMSRSLFEKLVGDNPDQLNNTDIFVPNYPSDLNVMHEAACSYFHPKGAGEGFVYIKNLCQVTGTKVDYVSFALIHATAAQRAEAFLRTIGKWDDSK